MAFQAPLHLSNIASATSELWPSMKATLASPWRSFRHPIITPKPQHRSDTPEARRPPSIPQEHARVSAVPSYSVPDCLASVPMAALQLPPSSLGRQGLSPLLNVSRNTLRSANPLTRTLPGMLQTARLYSTLPPFRISRLQPIPRQALSAGSQRRLLSVGSTQNLLAHMEQTANNNPTSATAQNAFYSALLRANMPAIIVERYQTGRYASSPACEATYLRALERVGQIDPGSGLSAGTHSVSQNSALNNDQMQAIGQAIAAQSRGGNIASVRGKSGSTGTGAKESPLYVVVEESIGGTIFKWAKFLLYFGLVTYFSLVLITVAVETTGVLKKVGGVQHNEILPQQQTTRFSDVHGCDEAKEELQELVEFLKNTERFSALGGKLPKGVLLVGPPGTGKTLLARAVAGEAGVPFFYMSGSEFDEVYVGVGAKRVRELFNSARAKAPAIVFIDELDAIGGKRNERDAAYVKQTLNQLLTELDGFSQQSGVIILAATNFPQLLDKALTRPGRFDRHVIVPLPDVRGRMEILKHHMRNIQIATEVDETVLARLTPGFSGADLENLVNQAAVRASRNQAKKVGILDFDWARDKIMMGAERRSFFVMEKDRIITAYHEGGHALLAMFTVGADPLYKATIMPRGQTLGITYLLPEMDRVSMSKQEYLACIDIAMAGKAAEELIYGSDNVTNGCSSDITNATSIAFRMVTEMGFSDVLGNVDLSSDYHSLSSDTKAKIEHEVRRLVDEGHQRAMKMLVERRAELDIIAKALVEYEVLDLEEMQKLLRGEKLNKLSSVPNVPLKLPGLSVGLPGLSGPTGAGASVGKGRGGRGAGRARMAGRSYDGMGVGADELFSRLLRAGRAA
ncbi:MAG: intermembrane space AAA protease IAP-1 [Lasallia pustulata]|uniref:Intermembrane space AAA protease IAP-1 n=1 Tax=Lasallia pustulata TaxID=136370 RepID=A0A5M8PNT7_9LECA|nr:MAG: intermembrane space AAA protease IAP-1 [Lasallia pustulata]